MLRRTACPAARSRPPRTPRCRSAAAHASRVSRALLTRAPHLRTTRLPHERAVRQREQLRVLTRHTRVSRASLQPAACWPRTTFSQEAQAAAPALDERRDMLPDDVDGFMHHVPGGSLPPPYRQERARNVLCRTEGASQPKNVFCFSSSKTTKTAPLPSRRACGWARLLSAPSWRLPACRRWPNTSSCS